MKGVAGGKKWEKRKFLVRKGGEGVVGLFEVIILFLYWCR